MKLKNRSRYAFLAWSACFVMTLVAESAAQTPASARWLTPWNVKWMAIATPEEAQTKAAEFPVSNQELPANAASLVVESSNAIPITTQLSPWLLVKCVCQFEWPQSGTATLALDIPPKPEEIEKVVVLINGTPVSSPLGHSPLFAVLRQGSNELTVMGMLENPTHLRVRVSAGGRAVLLKEIEDTYKTARKMWDDNQYLQAARLFETMVPLEPLDEGRYFRWWDAADLYDYLGRNLDCARTLRYAAAELPIYDPRHIQIVEKLARTYTEKLYNAESAIQFLEATLKAHGRDRDYTRLASLLARIYVNVGDTDKARALYEDIIFRSGIPEDRERAIEALRHALDREQLNAPGVPVSLDMSNLLGLYLARAKESKWNEAIPYAVDALQKYGDSIIEGSPILAVSTLAKVQEYFSEIPEADRKVYWDLYGGTLTVILSSRKREEVESFLRTHPFPDFLRPLSVRVGDLLVEEGNTERAEDFYQRALSCPGDNPDNSAIQSRLALFQTKDHKSVDYVNPPRALKDYTANSLPMDQAPLVLREWQAGWIPGRSGNMPPMLEEVVPFVFSGDHHRVFFHAGDRVYAMDPVAGQVVWKRETSMPNVAEPLRVYLRNQALTRCYARFFTSQSNEAIYYRLNWEYDVTGLPRESNKRGGGGGRSTDREIRESETPCSALYAARKEDGALLWTTEGNPQLRTVQFNTDPGYGDGVVVAGAWEPRDVPDYFLVGVDAVNGEVLWKTHLFFGTPFMIVPNQALAMGTVLCAPPPSIIKGTAYYISGASVIAAVDVQTGSIRWMRQYKRDRVCGPEEWGITAALSRPTTPVLDGGKYLLVSPQEGKSLLFMDPEDGHVVHEYFSYDYRTLIGIKDNLVYVQKSNCIVAIKLDDFSIAWERTLPEPRVFGAPTLSPRGILCPTWYNLYVLDVANGNIIDSRLWGYGERGGNFLDLGDMIIGAHHNTVKIFGPKSFEEKNWWLPRGEENQAAKVIIPAREDEFCRWMLPARGRGNYFVSSEAPDKMVVQAPDTMELRQNKPVPSLLWERSGPAYPKTIMFDEQYIVQWWPNRIHIKDTQTGADLVDFQGTTDAPPYQGAFPYQGDVLWFNTYYLAVINPRENKKSWENRSGDPLRAICPNQEGIGAFFTSNPKTRSKPRILLFDRATGNIKYDKELVQDATKQSILPVWDGNSTFSKATDLVLLGDITSNGLNHITLNRIDWKSGTLTLIGQAPELRFPLWKATLFGDYLIGQDGNGGAIWVYNLKTNKSIPMTAPSLEGVKGNRLLARLEALVMAYDLDTGNLLWRSRSFSMGVLQVTFSGKHVLAAFQRGTDELGDARVVILNGESGEVLKSISPLSIRIGKAQAFNEHLYLSDRDFIYDFCSQPPETPKIQTITLPVSDPMAVSALHLASSIESATRTDLRLSSIPFRIDGNLDEWNNAAWNSLEGQKDWVPDSIHHSRVKNRGLPAQADCSARFAVCEQSQSVALAVDVRDDVHIASAQTGLGAGDSVRVEFKGVVEGGIPDIQGFNFAQVDGIPICERGDFFLPDRILPDFLAWPAPAREVLTAGTSYWLRKWQKTAKENEVGWKINLAIYRDDDTKRTQYEIQIPRAALPLGNLEWDLSINDNDGQGREGALELGASSIMTGTNRGYVTWPGILKEASS